jgi:PAS domain S-box-containing protein
MLMLAVLFTPVIALLHRDLNNILFYSDMTLVIIAFALVRFLRLRKQNFHIASILFVSSLFFAITLVFFLAGDDPTKIIWAPIFFSCAFFLLGSTYGIFFLFLVLLSYALGYLLLGEAGVFYSGNELLLISISFIAVSLLFNAFRQKNDSDNNALLSANLDLETNREELRLLNEDLEKRINEALSQSRYKTKAIQHHLDIINRHVITANIDLNGLITNVSEAYTKLVGYPKEHFIGKPFTLMLETKTDEKRLQTIWEELQEKKDYLTEVNPKNSSGQEYWLDMHISPEYAHDNELIGYLAVSHDITDKKRVLQQQEQLISQSRHAAMGEMISMIAHQWRQPLATISAISNAVTIDLALNQIKHEELEEQMHKIGQQTQHLSSTITDFRDFFKPDKGLENAYVHKLVEEAALLMHHRLNKGISLVYTNSIDICLPLYKNELIQVLINILGNACDALSDANVDKPCICINEYVWDKEVIIEISDNAGGIPENILANIFEPYFSTKTKNGTGLGLYMSKLIVEDHQQGTLTAFNNDEGAVFKIVFPLSVCISS